LLNLSAAARWVILALYVAFVTTLSLAPARTFEAFPIVFPYEDKLIHFFLYGVLVLLGRWTLSAHWRLHPPVWAVVLGAVLYGALMEVMQSILASYGRSFELLDIVANSLGALAFWWLSIKIIKTES
jgi:VanZ family protein